ncbi:hypothetical protein CBS101457_003895 [Exobasidium rhododendri]|nr:hypothetical protein CBS101457_003895 [Exobasidium rhododendri]
MAPMHSGFLEEYPLIRVDNFTSKLPLLPPSLPTTSLDDLPSEATHFSQPHLSLLSHPHTDHLAGLSSLSRQSAPIFCSDVTKRLLLAMERKVDRQRFDAGLAMKKCPYRMLRKSQKECQVLEREAGKSSAGSWDLLHSLSFNSPIVLPYTARTSIRLTLLCANHMPGSTMFLIEGERGAILHTGDMRAEEQFIQALLTKSHLCRLSLQHFHIPISPENRKDGQPFEGGESDSIERCQKFVAKPRLSNIYLDTERLLDSGVPLTKSEAILDVIQILRLFPRSTRVYIGCWTSGYEEFLISLSKAFPEGDEGKIHMDRYKKNLYQLMAHDPTFDDLWNMGATDKNDCGRFCACEEEACIESCDVRIEANEGMDASDWRSIKEDLLKRIRQARRQECPWPQKIPLPLQRHSPLREIFAMIRKLQPVKVTANTAHCPARFILAQISQRLTLCGCKDETDRQRSLMGSKGRIDAAEWKTCSEAWSESLKEGDEMDDEAFFQQVRRFKSTLRGRSRPDTDRIAREAMDAEEGPASNQSIVASSLAPASGPWNEKGRYAANITSPFLTPAMRRAAMEKGSVSPEKKDKETLGPALTVELASRYLAYASMFLGWRIRNPSRYRPELAWKAVRKMRPDLAKQSEEALLKELGLAIPAWEGESSSVVKYAAEETSKTSLLMVERDMESTPTLNTTTCEGLNTPPNRAKSLQESISPFQLGSAARLLHRLDEKVASQEMNGGLIEGREEDVELVKVTRGAGSEGDHCFEDTTEEDQENVAISLDEDRDDFFANLEMQLRESQRNIIFKATRPRGERVYSRIMSEWQHVEPTDMNRFSSQLNLIGAAVRSRRGKAMLCWEKVNFLEAYQSLKSIYATRNASLPHRGRVVLRHLREEIRGSH